MSIVYTNKENMPAYTEYYARSLFFREPFLENEELSTVVKKIDVQSQKIRAKWGSRTFYDTQGKGSSFVFRHIVTKTQSSFQHTSKTTRIQSPEEENLYL